MAYHYITRDDHFAMIDPNLRVTLDSFVLRLLHWSVVRTVQRIWNTLRALENKLDPSHRLKGTKDPALFKIQYKMPLLQQPNCQRSLEVTASDASLLGPLILPRRTEAEPNHQGTAVRSSLKPATGLR